VAGVRLIRPAVAASAAGPLSSAASLLRTTNFLVQLVGSVSERGVPPSFERDPLTFEN